MLITAGFAAESSPSFQMWDDRASLANENLCFVLLCTAGCPGCSCGNAPGRWEAHRPLHPSESPSSVLILLIGSPWWDRLGIACLIAARSLPLPRPCRRCCPALLSTSPSETRLPRSLFLEAARDDTEAGRGSGAVPGAVPGQGVFTQLAGDQLRGPLSCPAGLPRSARPVLPTGRRSGFLLCLCLGEGFLIFKHFTLNSRSTTCVKADLLTAVVFIALGFRIVLKL